MQSRNGSTHSVLEQYAGTRVLVLGASGFIGRWVARLLSQAGADLYLPARDCLAAKKTFVEYDIEGNIFKIDLEDSALLRRVVGEINPTITFNLAGYGVDRRERMRETAYEINARLPEIVSSALFKMVPDTPWKGQRFVHAGTAMEYGAITGDLREDSHAAPTTLYGRSKLDGTMAVASFCERTKFSAVTARLFAVYGPGEATKRLLPTLVNASRQTDTVELTAGLHKRDFTYVGEVASALLRLGVFKCRPGEIVNVATGKLTSIRSFAETAAQCLGMEPTRLRFGALETRPEEMAHGPVNIDRLTASTGWKPQVEIEDGIRRTLRFSEAKRVIRAHAARSQAV